MLMDGGGDDDQLARCKLWWGGSGMRCGSRCSRTRCSFQDRKPTVAPQVQRNRDLPELYNPLGE